METLEEAVGPTPTVDPEFRSLIPPVSPGERAALEASLKAEGCLDALRVWKGHGILLDGHTRLDLCQQHQIKYQTVEIELASRDAAKEWIIWNQLGRRNLTPFVRAELVAYLEPLIAARAKENQRGCQKSDKPLDTKKEMAQLAGMSHDTWVKAKRLITSAPPEVKQQLRGSEISINKAVQPSPQQSATTKELPPFLVSDEAVYIVLPLRRVQVRHWLGPHVALILDSEAAHNEAEIRSRNSVLNDINSRTLWPAADRADGENILGRLKTSIRKL